MKNLFTCIVLTTCLFNLKAQKFEVTQRGLLDVLNTKNEYLVLEVEGKDANFLYNESLKFIALNYKNPDEVIKAKIENEYLRFESFMEAAFIHAKGKWVADPVNVKWTTELKFKDSKVRYEITPLDMIVVPAATDRRRLVINGSQTLSQISIFKQDGNERNPETRINLQNFLNGLVSEYLKFLNDTQKEEDW